MGSIENGGQPQTLLPKIFGLYAVRTKNLAEHTTHRGKSKTDISQSKPDISQSKPDISQSKTDISQRAPEAEKEHVYHTGDK